MQHYLFCLLSVGIQAVVSKWLQVSHLLISFLTAKSASQVFVLFEPDQMMVVRAEKPWTPGREFFAAVLPPHI